MSNSYNYDSFKGLTPTELLFFIMVDQTCEQLGIDDAEGVFLILAGLPLLPTRQKFVGATKGTSLASVLSRTLIN